MRSAVPKHRGILSKDAVLCAARSASFDYVPKHRGILSGTQHRPLLSAVEGSGCSTRSERLPLFYRAYGQPQINPLALAYYRYERIVQDIAVYCEQIFLTDEGGEDREQSFRYLTSNFQPNNVLEIAYQTEVALS